MYFAYYPKSYDGLDDDPKKGNVNDGRDSGTSTKNKYNHYIRHCFNPYCMPVNLGHVFTD